MNVASKISTEIAIHGVIPFARFMELALYCPVYGYYEAEKDTVGRAGDFYTSVSVGSLFGQLLAFQFAEWLEQLPDKDCRLQLAEAGAHNGQLALDILTWLRVNRPALFGRIEYVIIEPSPTRQKWQQKTLDEFAGKISWVADLKTLKVCGVIFSNELLDAFPVHRYGWEARNKTWFEWGVTKETDKFVWAKIPTSTQPPYPAELASFLPDGYITETSPAAETWWRDASTALQQGKLLAIDYGLTEAELFSPARAGGTLRSYRAHRSADNVLANAGEQDITAHVNFPAVQSVGERCDLKTEALVSQPKFLTQIVEQISKSDEPWKWTSERARELQTLVHPEHLGRAFRVLIQSRNG